MKSLKFEQSSESSGEREYSEHDIAAADVHSSVTKSSALLLSFCFLHSRYFIV